MDQAIKALIAAMMLLVTAPVIGGSETDNTPAKLGQPSFDESRGVILEGDAAREVAGMCGAKDDSKGWRISPSDIKSLEKELAPLLADDLKRVRANASPHQYYRQYASGTFANRNAIFVNGFHESHLSTFNDTSWQSRPVAVSDGGNYYRCAIYVKGMKRHFVTYKNDVHGAGNMHVSFHGQA